MNKNQKGKLAVILLGAVGILLCLFLVVWGVILVISGAVNFLNNEVLSMTKIILGALLAIGGLIFGVVSISVVWVGGALKATKGSLKDEPAQDKIVNVKLCSKCGKELKENDRFCKECGFVIDDNEVCKSCNYRLEKDSKFCSFCGEKVKKD